MKKVLILGISGFIGKALAEKLSGSYKVYGTYFSHRCSLPSDRSYKLDMDKTDSIDEILEKADPDIVISCLRGDYDKQLEVHKKTAFFLNEKDGRLYFCSTVNVFDKDVGAPHYEDDETNAESDYGMYKIKCENAIKEILDKDVIIIRLPMMWGRNYPRPDAFIGKAMNGEEIEAYENLYINNNTDIFLAKQIHYIIDHDLTGIFHLGSEVVNYIVFLTDLLKRMGCGSTVIKKATLPEDKYYLAIVSRRSELPEGLRITNEDIIGYLSGNNPAV